MLDYIDLLPRVEAARISALAVVQVRCQLLSFPVIPCVNVYVEW